MARGTKADIVFSREDVGMLQLVRLSFPLPVRGIHLLSFHMWLGGGLRWLRAALYNPST